jgi:hypothetical protein
VPTALLKVIMSQYEQGAYQLRDARVCSAPVSPAKGVKQGFLLGPLLFARYKNDLGEALLPEPGQGGGESRLGRTYRCHMVCFKSRMVKSC